MLDNIRNSTKNDGILQMTGTINTQAKIDISKSGYIMVMYKDELRNTPRYKVIKRYWLMISIRTLANLIKKYW